MSKFNSHLGRALIKERLRAKDARIHFAGVGGVGMYSLFRLTASLGYSVTGSDMRGGELFLRLSEEGYNVWQGSSPEAVTGAALVVYSLALKEDDRELLSAAEEGIPAASRAEYLGYIMEEYKNRITVSGSHGKSTVTAMIFAVLKEAGHFPSAISGASLSGCCEPYFEGEREYIVAEACEYKDSFLSLSPTLAVFTNLELDHTDYFPSIDDIGRSFRSAMERAELSVYNADDPLLSSLARDSLKQGISFGALEGASYQAVDFSGKGGKYSFSVKHLEERIAKIELSVIGRHNMLNALAAFAAAHSLGVPAELAARALSEFRGIERRLELIYADERRSVYYDYAHHPSEIRASIEALREGSADTVSVIFKPHTYSRTRDLFDGFVESLSLADRVLLLEVDGIREEVQAGCSSPELAKRIGNAASLVAEEEALALLPSLSGNIVIMGAAPQDALKKYYEDLKGS